MFMIMSDGTIWDDDLNLLAELLVVIDKQLVSILGDWKNHPHPDTLHPRFDRAEHIMGIGFVACQAYVTATRGFLDAKKDIAFSVGPCLGTGQRIVQIVNHAANYWKHHEEWHLEQNSAYADRILDAFDIVMPDHVDYPLSGILTALSDSETLAFTSLVPKLSKWRDELYQHASTKS